MSTYETFGESVARRLYHFAAHPVAWLHWIRVREIGSGELYFRDHPRFLFWNPLYHVARKPLARVLGRPVAELDGYFAELAPLHRTLVGEAAEAPIAGALSQAPLLYVLARAERPRWIIETGISSGYSARLLLEALRRNGVGHLDSVGVDALALRHDAPTGGGRRPSRPVGWLVPEELRSYWTLHLGRSEEILPALVGASPGTLDMFLHDSLHQYATMRWEYATAYPALRPGGLLASHDIHASPAWPEFLAEKGITSAAELDHDLGLARRPAG